MSELPICGRDVVEAAKSDVEAFFLPSANFEIRTRDGMRHALRGKGDKAYVQFDTNMLGAPDEDFETFVLAMLVFGHEVAHYLHRHNDLPLEVEESNLDARSLEIWADFFGAKLALTVMTFGRRTQDIYACLSDGMRQREQIRAIGKAVGRLGTSYFAVQSDAYEDPSTRVGHCIAGITSFFDGYFEVKRIGRSLGLMRLLYDNPDMKRLMDQAPSDYMEDFSALDRISDIHQRIQDGAKTITDGMHPLAAWFLNLDYNVSLEDRQNTSAGKREFLQQELAKFFGD